MNQSGDYVEALSRMEIVFILQEEELTSSNRAVIARCDVLENVMKYNEDNKLGSHFYQVPDQIMPFYEKFILAYKIPLNEKLQRYV